MCIAAVVRRLGTGWSVPLLAGQRSRTFAGLPRRCRGCRTIGDSVGNGPVDRDLGQLLSGFAETHGSETDYAVGIDLPLVIAQ